jgi:GntR family transcriptional regulator, transcriptional repressor for pyruvate dehydrogenase complex
VEEHQRTRPGPGPESRQLHFGESLASCDDPTASAGNAFGMVQKCTRLPSLDGPAIIQGMTSDQQLIRQSDPELPLRSTQPIVAKDLVENVIERVIELLGSGTLPPDAKLPSEKAFMTAFGVGRSSVREALRSLVAMNLLETRPGKGYYISPLAPSLIACGLMDYQARGYAEFREVMEARMIMEQAIAQVAIERATERDIKAVERAGRELKEAARDGAELLPYTMRVHLTIAEAAHNAFLKRLFTDLLPWIMGRFTPVQVSPSEDVEMHERLMDAFVARDVDELMSMIEYHQRFWSAKFMEHYADKLNAIHVEEKGGAQRADAGRCTRKDIVHEEEQ